MRVHQQENSGLDCSHVTVRPAGGGGWRLTGGGVVVDGLLEHGDVLEGAEEQNHLIVLVPDGSHLHVEPHRAACRAENQLQLLL